MDAVKTSSPGKAHTARLSGPKLKALADQMVEAKSAKEKQRLRATIIRGFYGRSAHA